MLFQRRNSRRDHRCYSICCWICNANHSNLTGVRGQDWADAKTWFLERMWETCGGKRRKKRRGVIHTDRLSGKVIGVRGEDLLFMLRIGQGWAGGQCWDRPGIHLEWNGMVLFAHKWHTKTLAQTWTWVTWRDGPVKTDGLSSQNNLPIVSQ